jgi:ribonuclease BN (tRNA processing enzyme)
MMTYFDTIRNDFLFKMELTFLGTGSNNPSPHRGASSLGKNLTNNFIHFFSSSKL